MAAEPMTLLERLRNPDYVGNLPTLKTELTVNTMSEAADEIERLATALAESDALIACHVNNIDSSPRETWPKPSILGNAIDRHCARLRQTS